MKNTPRPNTVITVGRSYGSGGRAFGRALAARLGFTYLDKELLARAAAKSGLCVDFLERNDERFPRFPGGIFNFAQWGQTTSLATDNDAANRAHAVICDIMREAVAAGPCVIVGRSADYVLRDNPRLVSIFVHAPADACARRIIDRGEADTTDRAIALAEKRNRRRAEFYNFFTDRNWGVASTYDLCLDLSRLSMDAAVDLVIAYLSSRSLKQLSE